LADPASPLRRYLAEIGRGALLDRDEESRLAGQARAGREARSLLGHLAGGAVPEQRARLEGQVAAGEEARRRLVEANLRWAVALAKRYQGHGLALADLVQLANLGLLEAVERFDERRGFRFTTYASWWIREAITRGLANTGREIRLPQYVFNKLWQLSRVERELGDRLGRAVSSEEVAHLLGVDVGQTVALRGLPRVSRSLDEPLGDGGNVALGEVVPSQEPSVLEEVTSAELPHELERLLDLLDDRERAVLELHYGLDDQEPRSLEDVARSLGVTRERARQLHHEALDKLRHPVNRDAWERARTYVDEAG